ncbi:MAG: hypothetical protein AAF570_12870, partial [Bacteroidota bacterium]
MLALVLMTAGLLSAQKTYQPEPILVHEISRPLLVKPGHDPLVWTLKPGGIAMNPTIEPITKATLKAKTKVQPIKLTAMPDLEGRWRV